MKLKLPGLLTANLNIGTSSEKCVPVSIIKRDYCLTSNEDGQQDISRLHVSLCMMCCQKASNFMTTLIGSWRYVKYLRSGGMSAAPRSFPRLSKELACMALAKLHGQRVPWLLSIIYFENPGKDCHEVGTDLTSSCYYYSKQAYWNSVNLIYSNLFIHTPTPTRRRRERHVCHCSQ